MNTRDSSVRTCNVSSVSPVSSQGVSRSNNHPSTNTFRLPGSIEAMYLEQVSRVYGPSDRGQHQPPKPPSEFPNPESTSSPALVNRYRGLLVIGALSLGLLFSFFAEVGSPATPPQSVQSSQPGCAMLQPQ
jgi:hypothetical protein